MEKTNLTNAGSVKDIESLKKIIKFILSRKTSLGKTEIVKVCFLIDKYYAENQKDPEGLSTVTYVRYFYGPYSDAFPQALEELEVEGWVKNEAESSLVHRYQYKILESKKELAKSLFIDQLTIDIINRVFNNIRGKSLNEIKRIVYSLKEVKEAGFGEEIKLFKEDKENGSFTKLELKKQS